MNENIKLCTKLVGDIEGDFLVKSYQRGYRWSKDEVVRLLEDIKQNENSNYCLQPIVVKKENDIYELIDGQQRLTTIFLIYQYIHEKIPYFAAPKFSISYETRPKSKEYLNDIDISKKNENIDYWYMAEAYETIDDWFSNGHQEALPLFSNFFKENVSVIWYEVDDNVDSIPLFTRLNIGKIPLTSSELVKAMFLSNSLNKEMTEERQNEISLQWDSIEKRLRDDSFWYFLTNKGVADYQTRIDLVLDLLANRPKNSREKYYTFFAIDNIKKTRSLKEIWDDIQHTYLTLYDWYEDHEFYHKIGYLISSEYMSLQDIYNKSKGKTKDDFIYYINDEIRKSINIDRNYGELDYDKEKDKNDIQRLLLLFNIESVRKNGEQTQWFPFNKFKFRENGKIVWSLEHIHAQQSEGMKTIEAWKEWLTLHLSSIKEVYPENKELIYKIEMAINKANLGSDEFNELQMIISSLLTKTNSNRNTIANLALLNSIDNSALSNSTFDVNRNKIIDMDKKGLYIPFCTKMVFLKYYSKSADNNLHYWSYNDMVAYVGYINEILKEYLDNEIIIESDVINND